MLKFLFSIEKLFIVIQNIFLRNRKRIEKFKLYWRISDSAVWLEELNASVTMNYFYTPIQHTVICNTSFWINCVIFFGGYQFELIVYQKWFWVSRSDKFSIVILGENLCYSFNIILWYLLHTVIVVIRLRGILMSWGRVELLLTLLPLVLLWVVI